MSDGKCGGDGCAVLDEEEEDRKDEAEVNGQHQGRLERKGTIGRCDARQSCMENTDQSH